MGYSDNYLQVVFEGSEALIGQLCRIKITDAGVNECYGQLVRVIDAEASAARGGESKQLAARQALQA